MRKSVVQVFEKKEELLPTYLVMLYIFTRVGFLLVLKIAPVLPYFTYDDYNIYSQVGISDLSLDYFLLRQLFINFCCILNWLIPGTILNGTRVFNIVVYFFGIREVVLLCKSFEYKTETIEKISILLILMPQMIIISCSMIKDVLLIYLVIRSIRGIIYYLDKRQQNYVWLVFVLILLCFTRYGLVEMIAFVFALALVIRSKHKFIWLTVIAIALVFAVYLLLSYDKYIYLLTQKMELLQTDKSVETGLMNYLRISRPSQFYRLVFALPYMLTLGVPDFRQLSGESVLWMNLTGFFSFISLFLIPAFYYSVFSIVKNRQRNELLALGFFSIYHVITAINSPSLSRYMICVYPIFIAFSIQALSEKKMGLLVFCFSFSLLYFPYLVLQLFLR